MPGIPEMPEPQWDKFPNGEHVILKQGIPGSEKLPGIFLSSGAFSPALSQVAFPPDILMHGLPGDFPDPPDTERLHFPGVQQAVGGILPDEQELTKLIYGYQI